MHFQNVKQVTKFYVLRRHTLCTYMYNSDPKNDFIWTVSLNKKTSKQENIELNN